MKQLKVNGVKFGRQRENTALKIQGISQEYNSIMESSPDEKWKKPHFVSQCNRRHTSCNQWTNTNMKILIQQTRFIQYVARYM